MSERYPIMGEELTMQQETITVADVTTLPFGIGAVGADRHLQGAQKAEYLAALGRNQHEVPTGLWLPFDCMDERETIALADGTTDPAALRERRTFQLAGGTVLAFTKAAVAADAAYLRDATDIRDAYEKTYDVLWGLGIPDAAHDGCGASKFVQKSVTELIDEALELETFRKMGADEQQVRMPLERLHVNKQRRAGSGFYDSWTPEWHANFVTDRHPENYSTLRTADDAVHGHYASSLLVVSGSRYFAKNAFIAETGQQAFALTLDKADEVADMLGTSSEERAMIKLGLRDDSFNVANHIVAPGLEVVA